MRTQDTCNISKEQNECSLMLLADLLAISLFNFHSLLALCLSFLVSYGVNISVIM